VLAGVGERVRRGLTPPRSSRSITSSSWWDARSSRANLSGVPGRAKTARMAPAARFACEQGARITLGCRAGGETAGAPGSPAGVVGRRDAAAHRLRAL